MVKAVSPQMENHLVQEEVLEKQTALHNEMHDLKNSITY